MDDFMDMAKRAQELSAVFGNSGSGENQGLDLENIMKTMEMVQLIQSLMPQQKADQHIKRPVPETMESEEETEDKNSIGSIRYFDDDLTSPELKSIKSAIPYLEYRYQRVLAVMVKMIETKLVIDKFSEENIVMQETRHENWKKDMLVAMRPHMDSEKQYMIDMIVRIMDINEITLKLNQLRGNTYGN